ncbi:MAG TPA: serine/threonine-protein kinase [Polyangia bacterium]|nr:serine/threonine-protein kinase [Polyangia bacterium]
MPPPDPSHVTCALCRRGHDPDAPCSVVAGEGAGREGETVGERYELQRLLGAGGMGAVYEARHKLIGRRCAVKLLHPQYARQAAMLTRFQREARAAASLENEHIAAVTDFGFADDGVPFLVMERLEGQDLAALVAREGPLPVARAVSLLAQACRGLAAAHASDIVHRDLKPANLFLTQRSDGGDLVKVLDFGIAKLLDADETGAAITGTGKLLGTACYMPPEQAKGESDIDHRADIYALGAILYELLAGTKAHPGTNYNAVLFHILTQTIVPLRALRADLPAGLDAVVERAMAFDRGDRFANVTELHDAVVRFAGTQVAPVPARASVTAKAPISPALAATVATPATAPGQAPRVAAPPVKPPRRWAAGLAVALAVAAIAAVAVVVARPQPARLTPAPLAPPPAPPTATGPTPAAKAPAVVAPSPEPAVVAPAAPPSRPAPHHRRPHAQKKPPGGDGEFDTRNPYE